MSEAVCGLADSTNAALMAGDRISAGINYFIDIFLRFNLKRSWVMARQISHMASSGKSFKF